MVGQRSALHFTIANLKNGGCLARGTAYLSGHNALDKNTSLEKCKKKVCTQDQNLLTGGFNLVPRAKLIMYMDHITVMITSTELPVKIIRANPDQ